ncbi:MFS transporter [Nocardiopsis terrae]|uniref:MFS family permease n=1 Tax=Nocardiopsis terrae TaxID=372655 RepID=A0ABR9HFJ5_9ACTN|nr:MFS transporter [Nocardiopsis terrae]MBE1457797.1 MFS family permease [Nocardiopsis terrae]GHC84214.1 MFS transporter [Nocardiopsis terrae]
MSNKEAGSAPEPRAHEPAQHTEQRGAEDRTSGRNTAVLVSFTALTNLADGVLKISLPLIATRITESPAQIALVAMSLSLPWLLTALHVGVMVDRFDRRRLVWIANLMRLGAMTWLITALLSDTITLTLIYTAGAVLGVAEVIAMTSIASLVPAAVRPAKRQRANAWVAGAETACSEFTGPFLGGLLMALGASIALGATAIGYAIGILTLLLLIGRFTPDFDRSNPTTGVHERIAEGLRFLWNHRLLRGMAALMVVLAATWGAWLALMPLVAKTMMGLSDQEYGILLSALGAGGIIGALSVSWINRMVGQRWAMLLDLLGTAAMVAAPALTTNLWIVSIAAFMGGMGGTLWAVNTRTISQRLVPSGMLGRYNSAARLFSWGAMPLGAGLVGVLAEFIGIQAAFGLFALASLLMIIPFFRTVTPQALAEVPEYR